MCTYRTTTQCKKRAQRIVRTNIFVNLIFIFRTGQTIFPDDLSLARRHCASRGVRRPCLVRGPKSDRNRTDEQVACTDGYGSRFTVTWSCTGNVRRAEWPLCRPAGTPCTSFPTRYCRVLHACVHPTPSNLRATVARAPTDQRSRRNGSRWKSTRVKGVSNVWSTLQLAFGHTMWHVLSRIQSRTAVLYFRLKTTSTTSLRVFIFFHFFFSFSRINDLLQDSKITASPAAITSSVFYFCFLIPLLF